MLIPKYVQKSKHKEYRKKHRVIVKTVKSKVQSRYTVTTARLNRNINKTLVKRNPELRDDKYV